MATLCIQLLKRGFRNVFFHGIGRLTDPSGGNLVGPAFTLRNIPAREHLDQISAFDDYDHPQRKAIESGSRPCAGGRLPRRNACRLGRKRS